ncbi:MAG: FAD-dependent oxidoreductase [Caulobacteraceae bacterium]|nr:FAD-dependent oxidoreductase [Caulobacteraceae bacterium]
MSPAVAFVGAGPSTVYALAALLEDADTPLRLEIFEAQGRAGPGAPYSPERNTPAMLSNIASVEIPPVTETLIAWLERQPVDRLAVMGLAPQDLDDRRFYPRLVLGHYYADQFDALVERARSRGWPVMVRTGAQVTDVRIVDGGVQISSQGPGTPTASARFDHVVLATGHQWPSQWRARPGYLPSPWPVSTLDAVPATRVGVRGSSLTAMDVAVALALRYGEFVGEERALEYRPRPGGDGLHLTLMSRKGLLPEADFYFPLPHAPLKVCTAEAIDALIAREEGDLLDAAFALFRRELVLADPDYVEEMGLAEATPEDFSKAYFAPRMMQDPFVWARANLEEARRNHLSRTTVPWRDAILRLHEVFGRIVPHLPPDQRGRFERHLKPVFVDNYGAVPHEAIARLLALHDAGVLEVLALGEDYELSLDRPGGGARLSIAGRQLEFPVLIEARGQQALGALQFPFLSLLEQGVVRDGADGPGVAVDDAFQVTAPGLAAGRLFCISLPFLMSRRPFAQGLTSAWEMGRTVAAALASALRDDRMIRSIPRKALTA